MRDTGIVDDIDSDHCLWNGNPVTVSVGSYIRLLDIMIEAPIRLDSDAEFKKKESTCERKNMF